MAGISGTNTIFSVFDKTYPAPCEKLNTSLTDKVKQNIFDNIQQCDNPECYTNFIELLNYAGSFNDSPITIFVTDNGSYESLYTDVTDSEKNKIIRAHIVQGKILPETIRDRVLKITTSSRHFFYLDGINNTIFHLENNYPVIYANILRYATFDNVAIYFTDMPLFSLPQLYIDNYSV